MDLTSASKKIGIHSLKKEQIKIIKKIVNKKKNIIALLPTGFGKSACYIIPHLMMDKNILVISPLISLMEDQCNKLKKYKIPYLCFNSLHKNKNVTLLNNFKTGITKGIIYFSPESFLTNKNFIITLILKNLIGLICVDESHCLSSWENFRNSYKKLSIIEKWIKNKNIPILCLTASATKKTIEVMMDNIGIKKATLVKASFYKPQLYITCQEKTNFDSDINKIINLINKNNGKTIIYTKTIKESEKISRKLSIKNIKNEYYHSKRPLDLRKDIQTKFTEGYYKIIVSTVAFGMGIDISNIYLIIHYGISKDIESYYQEIGRGGRDGKKTNCITFWSNNDFIVNQYLNKEPGFIDKTRNYLFNHNCRQQYICNYFCEEIPQCNKCDNCLKNNNSKNIPIFSSYIIFTLIYSNFNKSRFLNLLTLYNLLKRNRIFNKNDYNNFNLVNNLITQEWIKIENNKLSLTIKSMEYLDKYSKKIIQSQNTINKWMKIYKKENNIRNILKYFNYQ